LRFDWFWFQNLTEEIIEFKYWLLNFFFYRLRNLYFLNLRFFNHFFNHFFLTTFTLHFIFLLCEST